MKKIFVFIYILFFSLNSEAIYLNMPSSAILSATNNLLLLEYSPASTIINPSMIQNSIELSGENLYSFEKLYRFHLFYGKEIKKFGYCFGLSSLNLENFSENIFNLATKYDFSNLTIGFSGHLDYLSFEGYDKQIYYYFSTGINYDFKNFENQISVNNFTCNKDDGELLPIFMNYETAIKLGEKSKISAGFEKEYNYEYSIKVGAKYDLLPVFTILASCQDNPVRIGFGAKFNLRKFNLIYSFRNHRYLKISHFFSISYE